MKRALLLSLVVVLLAFGAGASEPVLTGNGDLFTIAADGDTLVVTRRHDMQRQEMVVPATAGAAIDTDGRIAYDRATETLYVVWRRVAAGSDEIVFSTLDASGKWSDAAVIARGTGYKHADLRISLTRSASQPLAFLHAVWWKEAQTDLVAQYGIVAIEGTSVVSTNVADLLDVANIRSALDPSANNADGGAVKPEPVPTYPPLGIEPAGENVDVVFGSADKKSFTRVNIQPRLRPEARLYVPGGRNGTRVPYTKIHNAMVGEGQVQTHISGNRVAVYTAASNFRYALFENGAWSAVRSIPVGDGLTADEIAAELLRSVER